MDLAKFLGAELSQRTASVEVPELADYFDDEKPVWVVKGLTAA